MRHLRKYFVFVLLGCIFLGSGCAGFSQKDYDLQEKAYKKERQQQEEQSKDTLQMRW